MTQSNKTLGEILSEALENNPPAQTSNEAQETLEYEGSMWETIKGYLWAFWFCFLTSTGCSFLFAATPWSGLSNDGAVLVFIGVFCLCCAWIINRNFRF